MKFNKQRLYNLKKALLKLSELPTEEGVTLVIDEDELTTGVEVFVNGDEGLTPASDGIYTYGTQLITVEGGIVTNIAEKEVAVETPAVEEEVVVAEEDEKPAETEEEEKTDEEEEIETAEEETPAEEEVVVDEKDAKIAELEARIAELEAENAELKAKLEEPVADPIEEEMKRDEKKTPRNEMNYMAAIKKAKEIKITRK